MPETEAVAKIATEAFLLFDRQDDQAVLARIRGAALKEYVYGFKQAGQMIYGLGVDGAQACKRELARMGEVIEEDDIVIEREDVEYAYFKAKASRWSVNGTTGQRIKLDTTIEMKRQAKFTTRRDGSVDPNQFWLEQGGSKAMRNAVLNLVPEPIKQKVIDAYKTQARVVEVTPEVADAMTEEYHAAFKDKDERDGLVAEIHNLWHDLQATAGWIKGVLREAGLNEALSHPKADWSSVSLAAISDFRDRMKKAGTK